MYPDFQYLLQQLTGAPMPEWLSIFKTFGFLVALSFIGAAWTLTIELKRKEKQGLLQPTYSTVEVGKPGTFTDYLLSALLGFIVGYKVGGIFNHAAEIAPNPMGYLMSLQGNLLLGLLGAAWFGYSKYTEKKKQELPEIETRQVITYPHQRISEILMIAAIGGIVGAKVFNAFETWEDFIKNPIASLLSSSGLTFYGGLIVATVSLYYYSRKNNIPFKHLCDAAAPGLMLAYGIGRLGCHFAGDGDWGIFNSAYVTGKEALLYHAQSTTDYLAALQKDPNYFQYSILGEFGSVAQIPHIYAPAPSWLPDWMFAMNYPHNVNNEGVLIPGCIGHYCAVLPVGVFPTPLYEAVVCVMLFLILWNLRRKLVKPLQMFGLYLIFNGLERFFVEKFRVNYKYDWGFIHPTQAEIISTVLVLIGIGLLLLKSKQGQTVADRS
jgi:phosphatidylglycerol---prolipoprotein diacylglyceryl transferase